MKKLFLILIFIFCFKTTANTDNINEFEIEGFFLGESLLTFFSKDKIDEEINSKWALKYDDKFIQVGIGSTSDFPMYKNLEIYDEVTIVLKSKDNNYKIYSVSGKLFCKNKKKCLSQKKEISSDLENFFGDNATIDNYNQKHNADKTGNSMTYNTEFYITQTNDKVAVSYYNWGNEIRKEKGYEDNIKVIIHSNEFHEFLKSYY